MTSPRRRRYCPRVSSSYRQTTVSLPNVRGRSGQVAAASRGDFCFLSGCYGNNMGHSRESHDVIKTYILRRKWRFDVKITFWLHRAFPGIIVIMMSLCQVQRGICSHKEGCWHIVGIDTIGRHIYGSKLAQVMAYCPTYYHYGQLTFIGRQFHNRDLSHYSINFAWKLLI